MTSVGERTKRTARLHVALVPSVVALVLATFSAPESVHAQATGASTLLVIGTVSQDSDPLVARAATEALHAVVRARGYTIVALDPSAPPVSIDLHTGAALRALTVQTGVDRTLHLRVFRSGTSYALHLGLASRDGSAAISQLGLATLESVGTTLTEMASALLPAPSAVASGQWIAPPELAVSAPTPPAIAAPSVVPGISAVAFGPIPPVIAAPRVRRVSTRPPLGVLIGGAATLGASYVLGALIGAFGGYHDRTCFWGSTACLSPGTSWEPGWDDFRGAGFLPVAGPWIQLAALPNTSNIWPVWLVIDGLAQVTGLGLLIAGIVVADAHHPSPAPVTAVPSIGPDHVRLDLVGAF